MFSSRQVRKAIRKPGLALDVASQRLRNPQYLALDLATTISSSPRLYSLFPYVAWHETVRYVCKVMEPASFLEVGVGRGDTLRDFLRIAESRGTSPIKYYGFDTFAAGPPEEDGADGQWDPSLHEVSKERIETIANEYDVDSSLHLYEGNTRETLAPAVETIDAVDVIYVDGGHSYETIKNDFQGLEPLFEPGVAVVLDDFLAEPGVTEYVTELIIDGTIQPDRLIFSPGIRRKESAAVSVLFLF